MIQELSHIAHDYALQKIILGTTLVGVTSGLLGVFTFLRRQSLLGDAISHAALPGITLMFLFTHSQQPLVLCTGGLIAGIIGTLFVNAICSTTALKRDAALGIVLSVFFGFGLVLLTIVQKYPVGGHAFLHRFLFGDASTLLDHDVYFIACISTIVCIATLMMWKEFKLMSFDPVFMATSGFSITLIELIFTLLLVATIVMGLHTVGVILMSALCIASAVAARQWTHSLGIMALLSMIIGGTSCALGSTISCVVDGIPTGPAIVLVASCMVALSFIATAAVSYIQRRFTERESL